MHICFLDTNVLADWIIVNEELERKKGIDEKTNYLEDVIGKLRPTALFSYLLLETINANDKIEDFEFITSNLAIAETIAVTYERYVAEDLFKMLMPIKYLPMIKREHNNPKVFDIHKETFLAFKQKFLESNKVKLTEKLDILQIIELITQHKIDTYDAFLISQARELPCEFFITGDGRIDNNNKKDKLPLIIQLVKPHYVYFMFPDIYKEKTIRLTSISKRE